MNPIESQFHVEVGMPLIDVPETCAQMGMTSRRIMVPQDTPFSIEEEEKGIAAQPIQTASLSFEKNRSQVRAALQAILARVFREYNLPRRNGIDLGSGATGAMVEELLAPSIEKDAWIQVDANPQAVDENRKRHPVSAIMRGSYLRIRETLHILGETLDIATGLSSFDSTQFIEHAVEEVATVLRSGGYFLHMQDVRPGVGVGFREMAAMGFQPPYHVDMVGSNVGIQEPIRYHLPNGMTVSVGELFRRNLGRAIAKNANMELMMNHWVTARRDLPHGTPGRAYFQNILLSGFPIPVEEVSVVVTLAKKK